MADDARAPSDALTERRDPEVEPGAAESWEAEPWSLDLFHALRTLEARHPEAPRLGESARPSQDPVRLRQEASMAFAPATLSRYQPRRDDRPAVLATYAFGLFGPNGPLPLHLTDLALERLRTANDHTLIRFADIFHHRFLSLFYRAWASSKPTVSYDRPDEDRFGTWVGSLFGLGMASLRERDAMSDLLKLHFAGRLVPVTRNAEGLESIVTGYFGVPVRVEEFFGGWIELPPDSLSRLGPPRANALLGAGATVGRRTWAVHHRFRLVLGPLGLEALRGLLPGSRGLETLRAIVRNYVGDEFEWDVQLLLRREEVPTARLGESRLGWTGWLGAWRKLSDSGDLKLNPSALHAAGRA